MSETVKTGWLKNDSGEKFAPRTLVSQVQDNDGILLETKLLTLEENLLNEISNNVSKDDLEIVNSKFNKMATVHPIGKLFETEYTYNAWVHNNVKYDSRNDKIVVLWSASSSGHTGTDRRVMMAKINPITFETEEIKIIYDNNGIGAYATTYGFEILEDGTYMTFISAYDSALEHYGKVVMCSSSDYGESWTFTEVVANNLPSNASYEFFGLTKLSTKRLLMIEYNTKTFMYSDNNGMTWNCAQTSAPKLHEPCFIECSNGKIICLGRKSMYGTSNGAWNGTKQIEPAVYWISSDYGATWEYKGDSATVTEMTASNCCSVIKDGYIDLFVCSRCPHGDKMGVIYHYYASEEDALNDNWGTSKVVLYPNCAVGQDFSYIGCCTDSMDNIHIFYYDGVVEGETDIYYMIASKNPVTIPTNADKTEVLALPYSSEKVDALLSNMYTKLNAKINTIILQNGGKVEDEDVGGGEFYVTSDLFGSWDVADNTTECTDIINGVTITSENNFQYATFPANSNYSGGDYSVELVLDFNDWSSETIKQTNLRYMSVGVYSYLIQGRVSYLHYIDSNGSEKCVENNFGQMPHGSLASGLLDLVYTASNTDGIKVYVNGKIVENASIAIPDGFTSIQNPFARDWAGIGAIFGTGVYDVKVEAIRTYNKALTAEEVKNNYTYEKNLYS